MVKVLFVDDDDTDRFVLQRVLKSLEDEWSMRFVSRADEALNALASEPFDVLVSDIVMPGMNGTELLEQVREKHPDVVRIVLSGEVEDDTALRAVGPAQVWLSKPCNTEFLKHIVERACGWGHFLNDPTLRALIGQMESVPSVPELYLRLVEELRSPDTSFRNVAKIVSSDIGMTAKILKMVNSAFFGMGQRITNLEQAISLLGLSMMKALVLSVKVFSQFEARKLTAFSIEALMNHSVSVGALARLVAKAEVRERGFTDDAFTAGLLHDAGKLVLAHNLPDRYGSVVKTSRETHQPLWAAERAEFGCSHAEVGAYLLALWGLPDAIVEATAYHHRPSDNPRSAFSAVTTVHVANLLDHRERGGEAEDAVEDFDQEHLDAVGMGDRLPKWTDICHMMAAKGA